LLTDPRFGNLACFAAVGNMSGVMEVWDLKKKSMLGTIDASPASYIDWSPCGRYLVTAILSPRLRVENGFRIWNYHGDLISSVLFKELYSVCWNPKTVDSFVALQSKGSKPAAPQKVAAYVPPSLRNASPQGKAPAQLASKKAAALSKAPPKAPAATKVEETEPSKTLSPLEKEILNLTKKLKQIALLKCKPDSLLQENQKEKIAKENEIRERVECLIKQYEGTSLSLPAL
jgi:translation initiation factor 2A